jgi:hypothetical protein
MRTKALTTLCLAASLGSGLSIPSAQAAGCGGYVNIWVSGCAPWDNNPRRMPGAPGYVAPRPANPPQVVTRVQPPPTVVRPTIGTTPGRLVGNDGSTLISPGNRNPGLIGNDSAGLRR